MKLTAGALVVAGVMLWALSSDIVRTADPVLAVGVPFSSASSEAWAGPPNTPAVVTRRVWNGNLPGRVPGSIFPDGRRVAMFEPNTGELAAYDLNSGEWHPITNHNGGEWTGDYFVRGVVSADGKRIAYDWYTSSTGRDRTELRIIGTDGSGSRMLLSSDDGTWASVAAWSPSGTTLLVILTGEDRTNQIALVSVADGERRVLKSIGWRWPIRLDFSPDGRWIAYDLPPDPDARQRDLYVLAADGSSEARLVRHAADDFLLGWAPDGRHVLFASDRSGTVGAWLLPVTDGKAAGPARLIKPDLWGMRPIGFTPQGAFYYYVAIGTANVYQASYDPTAGVVTGSPISVAPLGTENSHPVWSPDGAYIAYYTRRGGGFNQARRGDVFLVVRSSATGDAREIPLAPLRVGTVPGVGYPRWFPDGRSVIILAYDTGGPALFRVDVQTDNTTLLFRPPDSDHFPHGFAIAPDGRTLFYKTYPSSLLIARDLETGEERTLFRPPEGTSIWHGNLDVSPDGRWTAFHLREQGEGGKTDDWLAMLPTSGGELRKLMPLDRYGMVSPPVWTPDGESLLYAQQTEWNPAAPNDTTEVWRLPLEGGTPERVGLRMEGLDNPRIHPNGTRIAFHAGHQRYELWVMEDMLPAGPASNRANRRVR